MKVTQEDFDKLPQLDRIEYRQKLNYIDKDYKTGNFLSGCIWVFFIVLFVLVIDIWVFLRTGVHLNLDYNLLFLMLKLYIILMILIDILSLIFHKIHKDKLNAKYFNLEVKKKKR